MVIFLAGVHGVGKTSLCSRLSDDLGIVSISASQLIKQHMQGQTWQIDKKTSTVFDNQQRLITATREFGLKNKQFLLDGHFALLDQNGEIVEIELEVFSRLNLSAVICVVDNPQAIAERLESRDQVKWSVDLVTNLQSAERAGALYFCSKTNTPLLVVDASDITPIRKFILDNARKNLAKHIEGMK